MTTVGEISVKISADLAPLRKAQADALKLMVDLDKAMADSAKNIEAAFGKMQPKFKPVNLEINLSGDRAADIESYGRAMDDLRARFNPLFDAQQKYRKELTDINKALSVGAINQSEHAAASQRAKAVYDNTTESIIRQNIAIEKQIGIQSQINEALGVKSGGTSDDAYTKRAADIEAYGKELDNLKTKFDPIYAAEKRHAQAVTEINRALSVGAINQYDYSRALNTANQQLEANLGALRQGPPTYNQLQKSANGFASNIKDSGQFAQQAAYQFNDLFVQLASGQSAFTAITQQGAQLSQMFQPGTGLGAAAKGLGSAFVQFLINPLNLAIVAMAATAAAVPLIWNAVNSSSGKTAADFLKEFDALVKEIGNSSEKTAQKLDDMLNRPRAFAQQQADAKRAAEGIKKELEDALNKIANTASDIGKEYVTNILGGAELTDTTFQFNKATQEAILRVRELGVELSKNPERAKAIAAELGQIQLNPDLNKNIRNSFNDLQKQVETVIESLDALGANTSLQNVQPQVVAAEQAFTNLQTAIDRIDNKVLKQRLTDLLDYLKNGKISTDQFKAAIADLSGLSFNNAAILQSLNGVTNAAVNAARALADVKGGRKATAEQAGNGILPLTDTEFNNRFDVDSQTKAMDDLRDKLKSSNKDLTNSTTAKGSKGEGDRDFISKLQSENEYIQKQLDLMGLSYDERVRQTEQLRVEKEVREALIRLSEKATPAQKAAVEEQIRLQASLNSELVKQKAAQEVLNNAYVSAAGDIGSAISGAISGTEDLGKAFANVALKMAEAVIQAQILQSFTGADGKMTQGGGILSSLVKGIFGGISFDGGGFTGSGTRSGGLDGKGGFMAMVHPNETVIDHTKTPGVSIPRAQSRPNVGGGTTQIEVSLKAQTDSSVIMEIADTQIKSRSPAIVKASVQQSQQQTKQNMPGLLANAQARSL